MFHLPPIFHLSTCVPSNYSLSHNIYQFLHSSSHKFLDSNITYHFLYYNLQLPAAKLCLLFLFAALVWFIDMFFIKPITDPLRLLPGPPGSLLESHIQQVLDPMLSVNTHRDWRKRFGKTFRFHGFGGHDLRMMSFDCRVINHVLNSKDFERPWQTRSFLSGLIGRGVFSVEGHEHTKQRRLLHSALTPHSLDSMRPIVFAKVYELRTQWKSVLCNESKSLSVYRGDQEAVLDIANWMSRASFDIMGLTTLKHDFKSIKDESEPFYQAYRRMFNIADKGLSLRGILDLYFPLLKTIWVNDDIRTTNESLRFIKETGMKIVAQRKSDIIDTDYDDKATSDLLGLLIRHNKNSSVHQLTNQQLLDHCSTFLLGGSDTVGVALSWCLHLLALNRDVQSRLRKDFQDLADADHRDPLKNFGCPSCNADPLHCSRGCRQCSGPFYWNAINGLPYLDNVVNECLRFCPPVHGTIRVAKRDTYVPISYPITLSDGTTLAQTQPCFNTGDQRFFKIRKGSYVHIPIEGWSLNEDLWGQNALNFDPDRWYKKPSLVTTFGGGSHMCLGSKFSVAEIKIFLANLLPEFEFFPVENVMVSKFNAILTRPFVLGKWEEGTQMPLRVRRVR